MFVRGLGKQSTKEKVIYLNVISVIGNILVISHRKYRRKNMKKTIVLLTILVLLTTSVAAAPVFHYLCCDEQYCICVDGVIPDQDETRGEAIVTSDEGSSGSGLSRTIRYLYGEFIPFLETLFVSRTEYTALEDRVFMLEARIQLLDEGWLFMVNKTDEIALRATELKGAMYNTTKTTVGNHTCKDGVCIVR